MRTETIAVLRVEPAPDAPVGLLVREDGTSRSFPLGNRTSVTKDGLRASERDVIDWSHRAVRPMAMLAVDATGRVTAADFSDADPDGGPRPDAVQS